MGQVGVIALRARRGLPHKKNASNKLFHDTVGMAIRRDAKVIESQGGLLLPDQHIYNPFEVGKTIHVLRSRSIRIAHQVPAG